MAGLNEERFPYIEVACVNDDPGCSEWYLKVEDPSSLRNPARASMQDNNYVRVGDLIDRYSTILSFDQETLGQAVEDAIENAEEGGTSEPVSVNHTVEIIVRDGIPVAVITDVALDVDSRIMQSNSRKLDTRAPMTTAPGRIHTRAVNLGNVLYAQLQTGELNTARIASDIQLQSSGLQNTGILRSDIIRNAPFGRLELEFDLPTGFRFHPGTNQYLHPDFYTTVAATIARKIISDGDCKLRIDRKLNDALCELISGDPGQFVSQNREDRDKYAEGYAQVMTHTTYKPEKAVVGFSRSNVEFASRSIEDTEDTREWMLYGYSTRLRKMKASIKAPKEGKLLWQCILEPDIDCTRLNRCKTPSARSVPRNYPCTIDAQGMIHIKKDAELDPELMAPRDTIYRPAVEIIGETV